jgi:hypothetical protein
LWWWAALPGDAGEQVLVTLWTIGATVGAYVSAMLVRSTWSEYRALNRHLPDEALTLIAEANFRREVLRLVKFVCLLVVGTNVWLGTGQTALNRVGILLVVVLLFVNTVLDFGERQKTRRVLLKSILSQATGIE